MTTMALMSISSAGRTRTSVAVSAIQSLPSPGSPGLRTAPRSRALYRGSMRACKWPYPCPAMEATAIPPAIEPAPKPPPRPGLAVHGALLLVQLAFGGFHVVAKALLTGMAPMLVVGLRVAIATPLLVAIAWRRDRTLPSARDWAWLALLGSLGVTANQILFIEGLQHTTASNASILMTCLPVFAVAAGALLGIESVGPRRLLGIALAVAGALVMVRPVGFETSGRTNFGNLLILGNCLAYALFLVLQRPILRRLPWRTVIAGSFLCGGPLVLAASLPTLAST